MSLPPLDKQRRIIWHAAHKWGINPDILWGVYGTETSFGHNVSSSSAGAVGPFQFLPSTARGMGVNPYDFHSAAYGAAKYLSQYKSRGTAGMLSAYNAGPAGGIQSGYVSTTLANAKSWKDPGGLSGGGGSSGGGGTKTVGGVDNSGARRSLIAQYLLNDTTATPKLTSSSSDPLRQLQRSGQELDNLLSLQQQLQGLKDIPGHKVSTGGSGGSSGGSDGSVHGDPKGLYELFWRGPGSINVKYGQREPYNFVTGHQDHVHVAANRSMIIKIGKLAQSMGLHVGENPHFGGVTPVHVAGSFHYSGRAIDVSGDVSRMRAFAHRIAKDFGL